MVKKLEISLGHDCNAACIFCYSSLTKEKGGRSSKNVKEILQDYTNKGCRQVSFTGGEPTIRKDIFSLIKYAKKIGYNYVELKTNLFMLSYPTFVEKLKDCNLDSISFSVFGFGEKTYSKITGINKSYFYFTKALENLKYLDFSLTANILISKYSYKDLLKITSLLLSHNINSFHFWYISTNELKSNHADLLPSFSSFKEALFSSIEIMKSKNIKDIKILHMPPCVLGNYTNYYFNERNEDITIVDSASSFNIRDESFSDLIKFDKCKSCDKINLCGGLRKDYYEKFGDSEIIPLKKMENGKDDGR